MIKIDFWNILFTIINVLVLYEILKKFLVKPVQEIIKQREQLIQGQLSDAKKNQEEALEYKERYEEQLEGAEEAAQAILTQAREQAREEREQALKETRAASEQLLDKAREEAAYEQEKAMREVEEQITGLAMQAARKILKSGEAYDANGN